MNDWIRIQPKSSEAEPTHPERQRREESLREEIQRLLQRGGGVVTHFEVVSNAAEGRARDAGVVSQTTQLLEELNARAREALDRFGAEVDALLSEELTGGVEETVPEQPSERVRSVPAHPLTLSPRAERAAGTTHRSFGSEVEPLPTFDSEDAEAVGEHVYTVCVGLDAEADAEGAAEDREGTGLFRLFKWLRDVPVSEWPLVRALRPQGKTARLMQLGVLLPSLLFGGVSHTEARESERTSETTRDTIPTTDKTYTWEEIAQRPELMQQVYEQFYTQWQQLQGGDPIPQTNERYVMPPFVLIKYMEPTGTGRDNEYTPHFVAQMVEKDMDQWGKIIKNKKLDRKSREQQIEELSDDLVGRRPILLETEEDWQRIKILMDQLFDTGARPMTIEESQLMDAAAARERERYGDPIPKQDPAVVLADTGRTYATDDATPRPRTAAPRSSSSTTTSSSVRLASHRSTRPPDRPTTGPTGLPMYTIGSGVTRQHEPAHIPDERERQMTTFRLMQATFGPLPGTGEDFNPRERVVELGEHTHDDEPVGDERPEELRTPPPAPESTGPDVFDFSTPRPATPEDRDRASALTSTLAAVFDMDRSLTDRRDAAMEVLNTHGTESASGEQQYRLDQFLFTLHGSLLSVELTLSDGSKRTLDLSSAETWSEFDRLAEAMD